LNRKQLNSDDFLSVLNNIQLSLNQINAKLDKLISIEGVNHQSRIKLDEGVESWNVMTLLSFPDHLRKTVMLLHKLEKATATQISEKSGRTRAIESSYLNQLVAMGYAKKKRVRRDVYFYIE